MRILTVFQLFLMIFLIVPVAPPEQSPAAPHDFAKALDFPPDMVSEELNCGIGPCTWRAIMRIQKSSYSKENLDRIFRLYSLRHPDMGTRLLIWLYARESNAFAYSNTISAWRAGSDSKEEQPDAIFRRQGDGAAPLGGRNEYYSFRSPGNPDDEKIVILKGTLSFRPKRLLDRLKVARAATTIQVLAYSLEGVEPSGIYYTFQSYSPKWSEWHSIMTFRQNQMMPIPTESVVFVNDRCAYVVMGSLYAVTLDAGETWSLWDAERDFAQGQWSDHWTIIHIEVAPNGIGTLRLIPSAPSGEEAVLHSSDFGRQWSLVK